LCTTAFSVIGGVDGLQAGLGQFDTCHLALAERVARLGDGQCVQLGHVGPLTHDLGHGEEAFARVGRVRQDLGLLIAIGDHVLAALQAHRRDRGHRLHVVDVQLAQLLDEAEDRVEVLRECGEVLFFDPDSGELGDLGGRGRVDGHGRHAPSLGKGVHPGAV
jgi:hypothetical protein